MGCARIILAECEDGYISQCSSCGDYNFSFKNVLINFDHKGLFEFRDWLQHGRDNSDFHHLLPNGRSVVFPGPSENLFIAFDLKELGVIEYLFAQAEIMLDTRRIIGSM